MSAGTYQRFSHTLRDASGDLVQHDFIVRARYATDAAALAVLPRLADVLRVQMPTDDAQIASNVRHIKNCLTSYADLRIVEGAPWIQLTGPACSAMMHAATVHFCGFDPRAVQP